MSGPVSPPNPPSAQETLTYTSPTGQTITFGDPAFPTVIYNGIQGVGMTTVDNFVVDTAYQPGAQFVRTKLKPAVLKVKLIFEGDDTTKDYRQSLWNIVDAIAAVLQPQITQAGTLTKTLTDGTQRTLKNVQYVGGLEVDDEAVNRAYFTVDLIFEAYDPTWYSATQHVVTLGQVSDNSGFSIPVGLPVAIGGQAQGNGVVTNAGNIATDIIVTFAGPLTNFSLLNQTTGQSFFIGQALNIGDVLTVDTKQGTVFYTPVGKAPLNLYSTFGGAKQWVVLAPGANSLVFTRDIAANGQCTITYSDAWNHG